MRMSHFINQQGMEKNPDQPMEIKENCEMRMIQLTMAETKLRDRSNTVWGRFKRRLLAIARRERL